MPVFLYLFSVFIFVVLLFPQAKSYLFSIGQRWLFILGISLSLSFCLTPVSRYFAYKWNVLDIPNSRKIHSEPTALLGGLSIFIAFILGILINGIFTAQLTAILIASSAVFVVSVMDDFKEIPAWIKLLIQVLSALFVMAFGIVLRVLPQQFGLIGQIANIFLTLVWIVGITNALNFFDGMDGLASGLGVILAFFLGMVAPPFKW